MKKKKKPPLADQSSGKNGRQMEKETEKEGGVGGGGIGREREKRGEGMGKESQDKVFYLKEDYKKSLQKYHFMLYMRRHDQSVQ